VHPRSERRNRDGRASIVPVLPPSSFHFRYRACADASPSSGARAEKTDKEKKEPSQEERNDAQGARTPASEEDGKHERRGREQFRKMELKKRWRHGARKRNQALVEKISENRTRRVCNDAIAKGLEAG